MSQSSTTFDVPALVDAQIVLMTGPSGTGKTATARRIADRAVAELGEAAVCWLAGNVTRAAVKEAAAGVAVLIVDDLDHSRTPKQALWATLLDCRRPGLAIVVTAEQPPTNIGDSVVIHITMGASD